MAIHFTEREGGKRDLPKRKTNKNECGTEYEK